MNPARLFLLSTALTLCLPAFAAPARSAAAPGPKYGLVIHGGAGVLLREELPPALEAQYRQKLSEALNAGYAVLDRGGPALEAVTAAINLMEDSPLFNAGKGAVFNADGRCELDASIMDGRTLEAGAVAGVHHIKNPIDLARDVMRKSVHVMLVGDGAEEFARGLGYTMMPEEYFQTDMRRKELGKAKERENPAGTKGASLGPVRQFQLTANDEALIRQCKRGTSVASRLTGRAISRRAPRPAA